MTKYSPEGTYQSSGSFNLSGDNTDPRGITYYDNALWVTDSDDNKVYRYSPAGAHQSSFTVIMDNDNAYGLAYYDQALWVVDNSDDRLYWYPLEAGGSEEPDVSLSDVEVNNNILTNGQSFTLRLRVNNSGTGEAPQTSLSYYRSDDSEVTTADTPVGSDAAVSSLASAQGSDAFELSLTFPASGDFYYYGACVKAVSGEASTANNCSSGVRVWKDKRFNLTSDNQSAFGITYYDNALWVVDSDFEEVYKYSTAGEYQSSGSFDLNKAQQDFPLGITYGNNAFWVFDTSGDRVYKYSTNGAYQSCFSLSNDGGGMTYYDNALWVVNSGDDRVFKYSTAGVYQSSGSFDLTGGNNNPVGITYGNNAFWVVDSLNNRVYKYSTAGAHQSSGSFNLTGANDNSAGITYGDNALWVVDADNRVYWYPLE